MMDRDSPNEFICKVPQEIKVSTMWSTIETVQEAKSNLQIKEIIGVAQINRASLGSRTHTFYSKDYTKGKRDMVIAEMGMLEKERLKTISVSMWKNYIDNKECYRTYEAFMEYLDVNGTSSDIISSAIYV